MRFRDRRTEDKYEIKNFLIVKNAARFFNFLKV